MRSLRLLTFLLASWSLAGRAQDARTDLDRSFATWKSMERYAFDVRFDLYAHAGASTVTETMKGHVVRDGERFLSNFNGIVTTQNKEVRVMRDDAERYVVVAPPVVEMPSPYQAYGPDSLLAWSKQVELLSETATERVYRLTFKDRRDFSRAELHVDKASGLILRMDLDLATLQKGKYPRLVFTIERFDARPAIDPAWFDTAGTVVKKEGQWVLSTALNGHELIEMIP